MVNSSFLLPIRSRIIIFVDFVAMRALVGREFPDDSIGFILNAPNRALKDIFS